MSSPTTTLKKANGFRLLPTVIRLAGWRTKSMWRFLLICWLGLLAMVILICAVPLFSRVALSAGIRQIGMNSQLNQRDITINIQISHFTPDMLQQAQQKIDAQIRRGVLPTYLHQDPIISIKAPSQAIITTDPQKKDAVITTQGLDASAMKQNLILAQGQWPQATSDGTLEVVLTQDAAQALGDVQIGDTFQIGSEDTPWKLRVVGLIQIKDAASGIIDNFQREPLTLPPGVFLPPTEYNVITDSKSLQALLPGMETGLTPAFGINPNVVLKWIYPFDYSRLDINNLDTITSQTFQLSQQLSNSLSQIPETHGAYLSGFPVWELGIYQTKLIIMQVAISLLLGLILILVLFLVSMQSNLLIERQATIIATLRSRGATLRNIFATFLLQAIILSIAAFVAGPILALLLVQLIARGLLTPESQAALGVITDHPFQALQGVFWYALVAILVAFVVMIIAINRAAKIDIVTLRRESSRDKRRSFWRRIYLDWIFIILTIAGYGGYLYLETVLQSLHSTGGQVARSLLGTLAFVAPLLFITASLMLFLRLFPLIIRLGAALASRRRSAPAVLALEQMVRQPRPASRLIVVLALAIAATTFLLSVTATKQYYTIESARFYASADFSGQLPGKDQGKSFEALRSSYSKLNGVTSATIGTRLSAQITGGDGNAYGVMPQAEILAVDASTYGKTVQWCADCSSQSITTLSNQLAQHRSDAQNQQLVYAIIDDAMAQYLVLKPGDHFKLSVGDADNDLKQINFVVMAQVRYIPSFYHQAGEVHSNIGMLVDFESFNTVYAKVNNHQTKAPNYLWLQTRDDAQSLASVRKALPGLIDERTTLRTELESPIHLDIIGVLWLGIAAALMLALIGTLLASWLSAISRQTNFAVLRALGMAPRQVGAVLLWEQGFVYILAFLLGIGLGLTLTVFAAPIVSLISQASADSVMGQIPFEVPPVKTVLPYTQFGLMLAGCVVICLVALVLMARLVSQPKISQRLRLNED